MIIKPKIVKPRIVIRELEDEDRASTAFKRKQLIDRAARLRATGLIKVTVRSGHLWVDATGY